MKVETEEKLIQTGYGFAKVENHRLRFKSEEPLPTIRVGFRVQAATQICYLARLLAGLGNDQGPFQSGLLWITDYGGDGGLNAIALEGMELQRRAYGENRPMAVANVHHFDPHEYEASLSMLVLAIVGGLDGYYYPDWGCPNYYLRLSGSSYAEITSYDAELMRDARAKLEAHAWIDHG